jgi:hypothetical protein
MSVSHGQAASAANFNAGFLDKNQDTSSTGYVGTMKHFIDGVDDAQTAHAGGGQGSALQISKGFTRFSIVATAGDSAKLPTAIAGMMVRVKNDGANAMDVFPDTGAQIDGAIANVAVSIPAGADMFFFCRATLQWVTLLGQEASSTKRGIVSTSAQSFTGIKTFVSGLVSTAKATFSRYIAIASQAVTSTGTINQLDSSYGVVRLTGATNKAVKGILAGEDGQRLVIYNGGSGTCAISHQGGTASAVDRIITPTSGTVTLQVNQAAALIYDAAQSRWVFEGSASSGGGGGGSLTWVVPTDGTEPISIVEDGAQKYSFEQGQQLYAAIRVPQSYVAGTQINMYLPWQTTNSSGTVQMNTITTLLRAANTGPGTDNFNSTTNQYTDSGTGFALDGTYPSKVCGQVCDLTSSTGTINSVAVSPGDLLMVALKRSSGDTLANDIKVAVHATEVKFSA